MKKKQELFLFHRVSKSGGPDGELAASQRYLAQRYGMKEKTIAGLLTDIGTEELYHI